MSNFSKLTILHLYFSSRVLLTSLWSPHINMSRQPSRQSWKVSVKLSLFISCCLQEVVWTLPGCTTRRPAPRPWRARSAVLHRGRVATAASGWATVTRTATTAAPHNYVIFSPATLYLRVGSRCASVILKSHWFLINSTQTQLFPSHNAVRSPFYANNKCTPNSNITKTNYHLNLIYRSLNKDQSFINDQRIVAFAVNGMTSCLL